MLTGCTAVGKTEVSLRWAEKRGAEIVSCDSLLVYRGMDLGTAKPTAAERARAPHHLIDLVSVTEVFDVTRYALLARQAVEAILARGRPVLVVGGSGFYLKSFFGPIADAVEVPADLRAELAVRLETEGLPALVAELRGLNPQGVGALDLRNPRRVVRALERCRASGQTLAELAARFRQAPGVFDDMTVRLVRMERPPEELDKRIEQRARAMVAGGLIEEVERLRRDGLETNPSASKAIGYRETLAWLRLGGGDVTALVEEIALNTRRLVKKQRTWFRTQLPPHPLWDAETALRQAETGDDFPG